MAYVDVPQIHINLSDSHFLKVQSESSNSLFHYERDSSCNRSTIAYYFQRSRENSNSPSHKSVGSDSTCSSSTTNCSVASSSEEASVFTHRSLIPPTAIASLLNLLEAFDADVDLQVAQVKESIKEARGLINLYKKERAEKTMKKERVEREKKTVDSDFWSCI